ncbi:MAG: hypothetical protein KGY99_00545 [Phycisphaerae bacterium]|nr:hypothetical protein [Phycisphaerae bacterium]
MPKANRTIQDVEKELRQKQRRLKQLQRKRSQLARDLEGVDKQIAQLQGTATAGRTGKKTTKRTAKRGPKRRRPKNTKPLQDYIEDVLAKTPKGMRVRDIMEAVKKAGYKTNSKNFYNLVAGALNDKRFRKVSRGVYALKK